MTGSLPPERQAENLIRGRLRERHRMRVRLLLSPLTRGAYFEDAIDVARAEYLALYPDSEMETEQAGPLVFLNVDAQEADFERLTRLSFVQAIFRERDGGLAVVSQSPSFELPEQFVTGAKYRGKTNELVTQLAINVGLTFCDNDGQATLSLLDPMAGRGTTLLWAARYGLDSQLVDSNTYEVQPVGQDVISLQLGIAVQGGCQAVLIAGRGIEHGSQLGDLV